MNNLTPTQITIGIILSVIIILCVIFLPPFIEKRKIARKEAEEKRKEVEKKRKEVETNQKIMQMYPQYLNNPYVKRLANDLVNKFMYNLPIAIQKVQSDVREQYVDIWGEKEFHYLAFLSGKIRIVKIAGLDLFKENLKPFDSEIQLLSFMRAVEEIAKEMIQEKDFKDVLDMNYPVTVWTEKELPKYSGNDEGNYYAWRCRILIHYRAPSKYYEPPKEWL